MFTTPIEDTLSHQYTLAEAAFLKDDLTQAKSLLLDLVRKAPFHWDGLSLLAELMMKTNHPQQAIQLYKTLLQTKPHNIDIRLKVSQAYLSLNDNRSALEWVEIAGMLNPDNSEIREFYSHVRSVHQKTVPPILFITLPKSGSVYIWDMLAQGLKMEKCAVSCRYFPDDCIVRTSLQSMLQGGVISQSHLPASTINKIAINRYLDKIVVHVRDPRQALLSWTHFVNKLYRDNIEDVHFVLPPLPNDYFSKSLTEQIDWQIDNYLPLCVQWIENWLDAAEDSNFTTEILFTQYETFVRRHDEFFSAIFDFYGISANQFHINEKQLDKHMLHFRKGLTEEWRDVFTPSQIERSAAIMTERIMKRFGWTY